MSQASTPRFVLLRNRNAKGARGPFAAVATSMSPRYAAKSVTVEQIGRAAGNTADGQL
jgi:hypothetical protein